MNKTVSVFFIVACLALQACTPTTAPVTLAPQRQPLNGDQAVFLDIDHGTLDIDNGDSGMVDVSGQAPSSDANAFRLTRGEDGIHIMARRPSQPFWQQSTSNLRLHVHVPRGTRVKINSFDAAIRLQSFTGTANIRSVSGEIFVRDSSGVLTIQSNRGDVTIESTSGQLHVAGNYGLLSIVNTSGQLDASTIMGTVRFEGQIAANDIVSLETDHGPVEIQLSGDSDAAVTLGTTTGVITCMMPGLHYQGQGCAGTLQTGQGRLTVRTVSGGVTLRELP